MKPFYVFVALLSYIAVGCGGSGTGESNDAQTGIGYYIDSAIEGVNYRCGSQEGKTDKEGAFTFEVGKGCGFYIGSIALREVEASQLYNGKKVVENDIKVARFLQSIDKDGNLDNGIQITQEILEVLIEALKEYNKIPETNESLSQIITTIKEEVDDFNGSVKSEEEAQNHLKKTQETTLKALFSGKTFYDAYYDGDQLIVEKVVVDKNVTQATTTMIEGGSEINKTEITVDGNKLSYELEIDGSTVLVTYILDEDTATYIALKGVGQASGDTIYLFYNTDDAKAFAIKNKDEGGNNDDMNSDESQGR